MKKKEYSPIPFKVTSVRKSPKIMYSVVRAADNARALIGASDSAGYGDLWHVDFGRSHMPSLPTTAKKEGSHSFLAAATAIRLATKEFPRSDPATTRQIRLAATSPPVDPRSRDMAVCSLSY